MITPSFWILSILFATMVITGLFTMNSTLIALSLPLNLYLLVAVFFAPGKQKLKASRSLSTDRITQGMDVTVHIQVTNEHARIEELHLSELSPFSVKDLGGRVNEHTTLAPGETVEYEYILQGWRGEYRFEGLLARVIEPFGLFEVREQLPAVGKVLVYPEVSNLKAFPIRPPQTKGFTGPIPSRKSGTGMDFFGIRQYQLGDSLRHVNWQKSARHSVDLFTNEYEQERIADVGLILDARPHCDIAFQGRRLFEYSVEATASLSEMFLGEGHCLSLLIYSVGIVRVFPGYGKVQQERVLKALATADTGLNYAMEHLRYLPARFLPPRGQLVYISPVSSGDLERIIRFRTQGYEILVVSPNAMDFERWNETDPEKPDFQLAARFAQVERDLIFNNLREAGVQIVNWHVDQPLSTVLDHIRIQNSLRQRTIQVLQ
jgi:uncharacterized protein (DUF58 family)